MSCVAQNAPRFMYVCPSKNHPDRASSGHSRCLAWPDRGCWHRPCLLCRIHIGPCCSCSPRHTAFLCRDGCMQRVCACNRIVGHGHVAPVWGAWARNNHWRETTTAGQCWAGRTPLCHLCTFFHTGTLSSLCHTILHYAVLHFLERLCWIESHSQR
jgi:hypothetical protein